MAIKINNTTVIYDDTSTDFQFVNPGAYTEAQLEAKTITGSQGAFTFCTDLNEVGKLVYWDTANNKWGLTTLVEATGGTESTANGYKYHIFTSPGTLNVTRGGIAEVALIAGGGGGATSGGDSYGGGGGSGGIVYFPDITLLETNFAIEIGGLGTTGSRGGDTSGFGAVAKGGGAGAPRNSSNGPTGPGGSGGGRSDDQSLIHQGIQPLQNPGLPGIVQYGQPGVNDGTFHGGSANPANNNQIIVRLKAPLFSQLLQSVLQNWLVERNTNQPLGILNSAVMDLVD